MAGNLSFVSQVAPLTTCLLQFLSVLDAGGFAFIYLSINQCTGLRAGEFLCLEELWQLNSKLAINSRFLQIMTSFCDQLIRSCWLFLKPIL